MQRTEQWSIVVLFSCTTGTSFWRSLQLDWKSTQQRANFWWSSNWHVLNVAEITTQKCNKQKLGKLSFSSQNECFTCNSEITLHLKQKKTSKKKTNKSPTHPSGCSNLNSCLDFALWSGHRCWIHFPVALWGHVLPLWCSSDRRIKVAQRSSAILW